MRLGFAQFKPEARGRVDVPTATLLARFSRIAYLPEAEIESELARRIDSAAVSFFSNELIDTFGYAASYDDFPIPVTVLAFRGTDSLSDWLGNIQIVKKQFDFAPGFVHSGFGTALDMSWLGVLSAIAPVKPEIVSGERKLWITGHSLGGSLAVLAAARFRTEGVPVAGVCSFGQPMIGNASFVHSLAKPIGRGEKAIAPTEYWRVVNGRDIVPRLPASFGAGQYEHGGRFYWLRGDGQTRQNNSGEAIYRSQVRPAMAQSVYASLGKRKIDGVPDEIADHRIELYCDELELLAGMGA